MVGCQRPLQAAPPHHPLRLTYIRDQLCRRFGRDKTQGQSLAGLSVLDIGCGGGLVAEPLARLGATVTGIDPGGRISRRPRPTRQGMGLAIDYRVATAEEIAASGVTFDAVLLARSGRARA